MYSNYQFFTQATKVEYLFDIIAPHVLDYPYPREMWYYTEGSWFLDLSKGFEIEKLRDNISRITHIMSAIPAADHFQRLTDEKSKWERALDKATTLGSANNIANDPISVLRRKVASRYKNRVAWTLRDLSDDIMAYLTRELAMANKMANMTADELGDYEEGTFAGDGIRYGNTVASLAWSMWRTVETVLFNQALLPFFMIEYLNARLNILTDDQDFVIPDFEFSGAPQQIAWLHELGITDLIKERCTKSSVDNQGRRREETNWNQVALIISSITGLDAKNDIKRPIITLLRDKDLNSNHHPFKAKKNSLFVLEMKKKLGLD